MLECPPPLCWVSSTAPPAEGRQPGDVVPGRSEGLSGAAGSGSVPAGPLASLTAAACEGWREAQTEQIFILLLQKSSARGLGAL